MIERIVIIDNADPVSFYGVNNSNMQLIRNLFPKLRVAARGSVIKVIGDDHETADFEKKVKELEAYCARYNKLTEEVILDVMKGDKPREMKSDDVIIYGINGKPISARTPNQQKMVECITSNDLTFALGPAGTGKTYVAIAVAVRMLKNREVKKNHTLAPGGRGRREARFSPWRHERQNRPLSPAALRRPGGYDTRHEAQGVHGDEGDTDSPPGFHARTNP